VALRIQKKIEENNAKAQRRLNIFKTLMATRADMLSLEHVQALNMIDIEFYKEKNIRATWDVYREHLNSYPQNQSEQNQEDWQNEARKYLSDLLSSMSKSLGYDEDILKKSAYLPNAYYWKRCEEQLIRFHLIKVLNQEKAIKIEISPTNTTNQPQQ
jgi:hypothetical protein